MKWIIPGLVILFCSCITNTHVERNIYKRTKIASETIHPLTFSETMNYNHPRWNDEEYSYKFVLKENPSTRIPIGQKKSLLDSTYFSCNLGYWSPWRSIIYEHLPTEFEGWIEILQRSEHRIVINHEVVAVWRKNKQKVFSGRLTLSKSLTMTSHQK